MEMRFPSRIQLLLGRAENWGNANWRNFAQSTQFVCLWNGPRPHEKLLRKMPSVPPPNPYANHLDRRPFTQASKLLTLTRHRPRFWDLIYGPFRIHSKELRPAVGIAIYRPFTKNIFRRHTQQWNSRGIRQNLLAGQTFKIELVQELLFRLGKGQTGVGWDIKRTNI